MVSSRMNERGYSIGCANGVNPQNRATMISCSVHSTESQSESLSVEISNSAQQYMSRLEWRVRASCASPVEYHLMGCLRRGAVVRAVVVKSNAGLARFRVSKHSNTTHKL